MLSELLQTFSNNTSDLLLFIDLFHYYLPLQKVTKSLISTNQYSFMHSRSKVTNSACIKQFLSHNPDNNGQVLQTM